MPEEVEAIGHFNSRTGTATLLRKICAPLKRTKQQNHRSRTTTGDAMKNQLQQALALEAQRQSKNKPIQIDNYSWGRDSVVLVNPTTSSPLLNFRARLSRFRRRFGWPYLQQGRIDSKYESFNESYLLLSNDESRQLFVQLLLQQEFGEDSIALA